MGEPRIRLQNISKYYYSETSVTQALRKVDLSFEMNEFVAITGESGSGKSTLLKVISGMEGFDEGELFIDGMPTSQYDDDDWEIYRREKIGYIFQDYSLVGHYTARDNIVSALMIMGMTHQDAVQKADQYLERVGLKNVKLQMASKLSSGQKQRLSIARALAKGTDIIVADEPTGNLDSETGEQIVRLLRDLSRDHLVIMVTHNYEQVEPYATRKVRLHDGDLVLDVSNETQTVDNGQEDAGATVDQSEKQDMDEPTNQTEKQDTNESVNQSRKQDTNEPVNQSRKQDTNELANQSQKQDTNELLNQSEKQDSKRTYIHRVASFISGLDFRTQAGTVALFLIFFFVITTVSFFFIGELLMNTDDRIAMEYDDSAFPKEDKTRIIAKRQDGKAMTEKDVDTLGSLRNVVMVDQYDTINDINYYYRQGKDYEFRYGYSQREGDMSASVEFLDNSHYMRSSTCLRQEDLAAGKLPEKRGEVVLYSDEGKRAIGSTFDCYLNNKPILGSTNYIKWEFTVTGVLKEKTDQIYFSPAMCQMLTAILDCGNYRMSFYFDDRENRFLGSDHFIPLLSEDLQEDEMQVSRYYQVPADGLSKLSKDPKMVFGGGEDYLEIYKVDLQGNKAESEIVSAEHVSTEKLHESGGAFLALSEEYFTEYNDMNSYQSAVYITSYAKTKAVMKALQDAGYDALSTYQSSVRDYDQEKVVDRLTHMAISLVVLLVTLVAEILILCSLMKLRHKDYYVWKFMGMETKLMHRISFYEMGRYLLMALVITVAGMYLAGTRITRLHEMLYYYEAPGYLAFLIYNLVGGILTVTAFHRGLERGLDQ